MNWSFVAIAAGCFLFVYLVIASWVGRKLKQRRMLDSRPLAEVDLGELRPLKENRCPDCGEHDNFLWGPAGGMCQNIQCGNCKSRFNIGIFNGVVFHAERI